MSEILAEDVALVTGAAIAKQLAEHGPNGAAGGTSA